MVKNSGTDRMINAVKQIARQELAQTSLRRHIKRFDTRLNSGKMLRARLLLELGTVNGVDPSALCHAGAAVEMMHAASLVHDDVLDGGTLRRGEPSLWVSEGTRAAVLLGDLLVSLATEVLLKHMPDRLPMMIVALREMCDAEAEQEFDRALSDTSWARCVSIARRKTGSLFGLAAACAAGKDPELATALHRAGTALGTAYQLADDLFDTCIESVGADKTLGTDALTGKLTAASAHPPAGTTPTAVIHAFLLEAEESLGKWPPIKKTWLAYIGSVMDPLMDQYAAQETLEMAV